MSWNWGDVYPGHRVLTVIIAPGDAETLQTMPGVKIIGEHVVLIEHFETPSKPLQTVVKAASKAPSKTVEWPKNPPRQKPATAVQHGLVREARAARGQVSKRPAALVADGDPAERLQTSMPRTINDDLPPHRHEPSRPPSAVTKQDIAMVEEAIASGQVTITKCPPMTFTPDAMIGGGWKPRVTTKVQRMKAKRKAVQQAAKSA